MATLFEHPAQVNPQKYQVILFDLGGVIFNIDPPGAYQNFLKLPRKQGASIPPLDSFFYEKWFLDLELGIIDESTFLKGVTEEFGIVANPTQVKEAWNSVLDGLVPPAASIVPKLAARFRLFLLSNSNRVHYQQFIPVCQPVFDVFEHCFFSFDLNLAKPNPEIYTVASQKGGIPPERTLFIDDSQANCRGAVQAGLDALHWPDRKQAVEFWGFLASWADI